MVEKKKSKEEDSLKSIIIILLSVALLWGIFVLSTTGKFLYSSLATYPYYNFLILAMIIAGVNMFILATSLILVITQKRFGYLLSGIISIILFLFLIFFNIVGLAGFSFYHVFLATLSITSFLSYFNFNKSKSLTPKYSLTERLKGFFLSMIFVPERIPRKILIFLVIFGISLKILFTFVDYLVYTSDLNDGTGSFIPMGVGVLFFIAFLSVGLFLVIKDKKSGYGILSGFSLYSLLQGIQMYNEGKIGGLDAVINIVFFLLVGAISTTIYLKYIKYFKGALSKQNND